MGQHRKTLRRYEILGHLRFLTFSCYQRKPFFKNDQIKDLFVQRLRWASDHQPVLLIAWVIMPEHVHLMVRPDVHRITMTDYLQSLKRPFAASVLRRWRQIDANILDHVCDARGRSHFWQTGGGYDRNIYTAKEYEEKFNYIHRNPVQRGLVKRAQDWHWSSARYYLLGEIDGPWITPVEI